MTNLKPCPFCGEQPKLSKWYYRSYDEDVYEYECQKWDFCPGNRPAETEQEAAEYWNTRAE